MGGQSSRFGSPKGNVLIDGKVQWKRLECILLSAIPHIKVYFSLSASVRSSYPDIPDTQIIYDDENLGAKGPMLGLMSAMYQYPNTACMLVSVDMFLLQAITIKHLFEQYITQRKLCTAYKTNKIQPLCAIYTYEVLPYIEHRVANAKDESDYSVNALIMTLAERETERGGVCFIEGDAMSDTDDHIIQSLTHINNKKELAEYYSDI